jgi:DNA processing protein
VQARGLDDVYPHAHRRLAERMRERGAVLSELPPGTDPLRAFFPLRNRLISGLAKVVVVVEARRGSGSLHTVRHGLEQGVEVMAVPGEIDVPTAQGPNRLIRDGAAPVLGVDDIFDRLSWVRCPPAAAVSAPTPIAPVDETSRRVLSALSVGPLDRAALAGCLGCPTHALALALLDLQLVGAIEEDRDGRLRRRR